MKVRLRRLSAAHSAILRRHKTAELEDVLPWICSSTAVCLRDNLSDCSDILPARSTDQGVSRDATNGMTVLRQCV